MPICTQRPVCAGQLKTKAGGSLRQAARLGLGGYALQGVTIAKFGSEVALMAFDELGDPLIEGMLFVHVSVG